MGRLPQPFASLPTQVTCTDSKYFGELPDHHGQDGYAETPQSGRRVGGIHFAPTGGAQPVQHADLLKLASAGARPLAVVPAAF